MTAWNVGRRRSRHGRWYRIRAASGTESVQFEIPSGEMKPVRQGDLLPQPFDCRVLKLHDMPAACADQMIVISLRRNVVILGLLAEASRLRESVFAQHTHRPVNRIQRSSAPVSIEETVQTADGDVILLEKGQDNLFPLRTPPQAGTSQARPHPLDRFLSHEGSLPGGRIRKHRFPDCGSCTIHRSSPFARPVLVE